MRFLSKEAAHALHFDQKPDGKTILWTLICTPGQYILRYLDNEHEEYYKGVSSALLRKAFQNEAIDSGWLPPNLARWGKRAEGDWVVCFYPGGLYTLQLGQPGHGDAQTISVRLPGMIFGGVHTTYYVWAIKEQQFSPQAPIFVVPLPNVWGDGSICYGRNTPPAVSSETWQSIETAWNLFIDSPFIGDLANGKSREHADDVRLQLIKASQSQSQHYPLDDLIAYQTTGNVPATVAHAVATYLARASSQQGARR